MEPRLQLTASETSSAACARLASATMSGCSSKSVELMSVCTQYCPATGKVTLTKKLMLSAKPPGTISNGEGCETTTGCCLSGVRILTSERCVPSPRQWLTTAN